MTNQLVFDTRTPLYGLPLLFAGQSQKEFFVNEALLRTDFLLHCTIEGEADVPPAQPGLGQAWLVGSTPAEAFAGRAGSIAGWVDGGWRFVEPRDGLRVFDRSIGSFRLFSGGWKRPRAPALPVGGSVIDSEARAILATLLDILAEAGVLANQ